MYHYSVDRFGVAVGAGAYLGDQAVGVGAEDEHAVAQHAALGTLVLPEHQRRRNRNHTRTVTDHAAVGGVLHVRRPAGNILAPIRIIPQGRRTVNDYLSIPH